jgi:putative Holliday junction resolvase
MGMSLNNLLGLDIGEKRIGVARVNLTAKIPEPLTTLINDASFAKNIANLVKEHEIDALVVGLPRNMNGEVTEQTDIVKKFVTENLSEFKVIYQDETLSSVEADTRLGNLRVPKAEIDSLAASIILEDYLETI